MKTENIDLMYAKPSSWVVGFHGCSKETFESVLYKHEHVKPSNNPYDWLGNGSYFWENSYERALDWANHSNSLTTRVI